MQKLNTNRRYFSKNLCYEQIKGIKQNKKSLIHSRQGRRGDLYLKSNQKATFLALQIIKQVMKSQQTTKPNSISLLLQTLRPAQPKYYSQGPNQTFFQQTNMFFMKSKHVLRQFKNHVYFQGKKTQKSSHHSQAKSQFASYPPAYGFNNAYSYVCDELSKNYLNRKPLRVKSQNKKDSQQSINLSIRRYRRNVNLTLPNLSDGIQSSKLLHTMNQHYDRPNRQFSIRKQSITLEKTSKNTSKITLSYENCPPFRELLIDITFMNKLQPNQKGFIDFKVNIYSYLIKTFLKTKVNYYQLKQQQMKIIIDNIIKVYKSDKLQISLKDVICTKTVRQIFDILMQYQSNSSQFREILRYYFIANNEVYRYQLNSIKEQIRYIINLATNNINCEEEIFMYDIDSGDKIESLLQLLKGTNPRFLVGVDKKCYELYSSIMRDKGLKKEATQRIKKWKSIIPNQTQDNVQMATLSSKDYQNIFMNAQRKHGNFNRNRKPKSEFISHSFQPKKLSKIQSIFQ